MLSLPKMTWMPDVNIASGGGGEGKYVIFTGLLPLRPKSFGQGCRLKRLQRNQSVPYLLISPSLQYM